MRNTAREFTRSRHIDLAGIQSKRMAAIQAMRPYAWYDANVGGTSDGMPDISGNDRDPIVNGAGSNAALFLPYNGVPSVYLPDGIGNIAWCPDSVGNSITGDITVTAHVSLADWTSASFHTLASKYNGVSNSWVLQQVAGILRFYVRTATSLEFRDMAHGITGSGFWYVQAYRQQSTGLVTFRKSTDGVTWTTLGTHATPINAGEAINDSTTDIVIGKYGSRNPLDGGDAAAFRVSKVTVSSGLPSTVLETVAEFDAALCSQAGFTDVAGNPWLLVRALGGQKDVVQSPAAYSAESLFLLGTDDFLTVPLNAMPPLTATDTVTAVLVSRQWHSSGAYAFDISDASPDIGKGIKIETAGTTLYAVRGDGSATITPTRAQVLGIRNVFAAVFTPTVVKAVLNGGSNVGSAAHTLGDSTPTRNGKVGGLIAGGGNVDMEFRALMLFNREPSVAELDLINVYYKAGM